MSFTGSVFTGYVFDPYEGTSIPFNGGFRVRGMATYSVSQLVTARYISEWKHPMKRSFMFGLYVDKGQTLDVDYMDLEGNYFPLTREDPAGTPADLGIVAQLEALFGTSETKKWVGFAQPEGKAWALMDNLPKGIVQFEVRVSIYPASGPQFLPFFSRHRKDEVGVDQFAVGKGFELGSMPSMWYVPPPPARAMDGRRYVFGPRGLRWLDF